MMKTKCSSFGLRTLAIASSFLGMLTVFLVAEVALTLGVHAQADAVEADEFALFFEFNSTDGDLGLQGFLDADAWRFAQVINPNHRLILTIAPKTRLKNLGLNEVSFESDEPLLEEEDVRDRFPEGVYKLKGRTVDGEKLRGEVELSHELPATVSLDLNAFPTIMWTDNSGTGDPEIVGYQIITELVVEASEERVFEFSVDLPAEATQVTVPDEFVQVADGFEEQEILEYKVEVIAIGENGNKTITEESLIEEE